eukprot:5271449-Prymnesium_polylepis.1
MGSARSVRSASTVATSSRRTIALSRAQPARYNGALHAPDRDRAPQLVLGRRGRRGEGLGVDGQL